MSGLARLNLTLADDPTAAAQWIAEFHAALPEQIRSHLSQAPVTVINSVNEGADNHDELDVTGQFNRLAGYWKSRSVRLQRFHDGMVELGYQPKVPEQRTGKRLASYLSYVDPENGRNLMNANSGTVYIMRKDVADEVDGHAFVRPGRQAAVELDGEEKVEFLLDVARRHKAQ